MISHFTGGNTAQPPESMLSPGDYDAERRIVLLRGGTFPETPSCPRPVPTPERTARAAQHRANTTARRANLMVLQPWQFPLFVDEPAVRCKEVCGVPHKH